MSVKPKKKWGNRLEANVDKVEAKAYVIEFICIVFRFTLQNAAEPLRPRLCWLEPASRLANGPKASAKNFGWGENPKKSESESVLL